MEFSELLALLQSGEGVPETIYDDLSASYQSGIDGAITAGNEASVKLQATIDELNAEITQLKSANFDLTTQLEGQSDVDLPDDNSGDEGDDLPEIRGIEDLFTDESED